MDERIIEGAAQFLAQSRLGEARTPALPNKLQPETELEGYAIQAQVHELLKTAGFGRLVGHKIGCTTQVMQNFLNINHPCAGEVFSSTVFMKTVELPLARFHRIGVECEIAARLNKDMNGEKGPYTRDSVSDSVESLMGAIELVDDRYENFSLLSAATLIGDDFFNAGVVLGVEMKEWRDINLENVSGILSIDGQEYSRGKGSDILGHPFEALAWLANHRASIGSPLRAGEFVMLGSVVETVFVDFPTVVKVKLEGLSEAQVKFY